MNIKRKGQVSSTFTQDIKIAPDNPNGSSYDCEPVPHCLLTEASPTYFALLLRADSLSSATI